MDVSHIDASVVASVGSADEGASGGSAGRCGYKSWFIKRGHIRNQPGVRRWELALQNSLGFAPTATMSFYRPSRRSSKDNSAHSSAGSGKAAIIGRSSIVTSHSTEF